MQFSNCAEYPKGPRGCSDLTGEFCTSPSETVLTDWGPVCKSRKRQTLTLAREGVVKGRFRAPSPRHDADRMGMWCPVSLV